MKIRTDSKSIALLAVFSSLVIALEIFPIPGVTDISVPGLNFTIDWTGIPIMMIFLGLGTVFSFFTVGVMGVFIGYRNFQGAAFKGLAEIFTLLGLVVARLIHRNRNIGWEKSAAMYLIFACLFRGVGMFFGNAVLFRIFFVDSYEVAFALSTIYVPWNIFQAAINVVVGLFLYLMIPENLRMQTGLGIYRSEETTKYEEISEEELKAETG